VRINTNPAGIHLTLTAAEHIIATYIRKFRDFVLHHAMRSENEYLAKD